MRNFYKFLGLTFILLSCENDNLEDFRTSNVIEPLPELTAGTADFSSFVSLGASFTAGFTDNALFIAAQENSFPNTMAKEFTKIGGAELTQPLMNDNIGGFLFNGSPMADGSLGPRLFFNGVAPTVLPAVPTTEASTVLTTGPFGNVGVPGAKSFHFTLEGYGALNPYFGRMASSPTASMLGDVVAQNPTFFTLSEFGGNDVLGFATSGGVGVDQTGNLDTSTYDRDGNSDITDPTVFSQVLTAVVTALTQNGAKGAIGNVPFVTSLPYFTTVPYNPVPLEDQATVDALNAAFADYNAGLDGVLASGAIPDLTADEVERRKISFQVGQNPALILDEDLTDLTAVNPALTNMRLTTKEDLIILLSSSFIGTPVSEDNPTLTNGVSVPLEDRWVLTETEKNAVIRATEAYNTSIKALTDSNSDLALVDLNGILERASTTGIQFDEFTANTTFVSGGLVSLDGIHLTARGYALMANEFLKAIDRDFGSNFEASGNLAKAVDFPVIYPENLPLE